MPHLIEMKYDPYTPRLNILINGRQPSDLSQLVQYADEDIWNWSSVILDAIYSDIRDDFYVEFTGTSIDAEIMRYMCNLNSHCLAFEEKKLAIHESLQKRMGMLNQFIKKNGILGYSKSIIDSCFIVPQNLQYLIEDIASIDIANLFCAVRIETSKGTNIDFENTAHSYLFSLSDTPENAIKSIKKVSHQNTAFAIIMGTNERFWGIKDNVLFYETTQDGFINTIFQCFLAVPLLRAFRECMASLREANKHNDDFLKISLVEPQVVVTVPSCVEVGKSVPIKVSLNPPIGDIPKLSYHTINGAVAECDGFSVFGKQKGITTLEAYQYGEKKPFFTKDINVFVRNRIKKIILAEDEITLGKGDSYRLNSSFVPENADNIDQVVWKSTNEEVIIVDKYGRMRAMGAGKCRIICSAENTSAACSCIVKPYLEEVQTGIEGNQLLLRPMQSFELNIVLVPSDCFDNTVEIITANSDIVNVVGKTLNAKNEGTTVITIRNKSKRKSVSIAVTVGKEKQEKKKAGFFRSLFNLE